MFDAVIKLANAGIKVFPLLPLDKKPLPGSRGSKDATTDLTRLKRYWDKRKNANVAIALGCKAGIVAVDCDTNHGFKPEDPHRFPRTVTVKTKCGWGRHRKRTGAGINGIEPTTPRKVYIACTTGIECTADIDAGVRSE